MIALLTPGSNTIRLLKKNLTLLFIGFTSICSAASIIVANADFKGDWTFNEQKSKLGEGRRMNALK